MCYALAPRFGLWLRKSMTAPSDKRALISPNAGGLCCNFWTAEGHCGASQN